MTRLIDLDNKETIKALVNSFLSWKLPARFSPDGGIKFTLLPHLHDTHQWPIGTHLFTADQAEEMIKHILNNAPTIESDSGEAVAYVYWENEEDKEVLVFEQISPERVVICLDYKKEESVHVMKPNADDTVNSKVYTSPPKREWRGLSDDETEKIAEKCLSKVSGGVNYVWFAKAIESKLKELNHG